ncbi:hypothetical protein HU724_004440 [Pseudomonas iranensis]|uniref:hypothetical protein n=1 Tax=Pseudomonas iranensis TaxID=2745503 RepID=UPI001647BAD4|nr:hypothetical protein [Pseudomonas iranensis]QXI23529.1 hypothetical protein HU724_004440 [Pseudomonas iranensis]
MTEKLITIQGTAPKYDEAVLKQHQAERHAEYRTSRESYRHVFGELPYDFLTKIIELSNEGYELSSKYPITFATMAYHAYMLKPAQQITADLEALNVQVKQSYVAWLESERDRYRKLLTAQLLQAAELKEAEKVEKAKAKLLADIQKEVDATFSDLVIPG